MSGSIGYMGTKRHIAPSVAEVVKLCRDGIAFDAFSGMCSVGEAISPSRQVWNNDTQRFASEVAKALFTSSTPPPTTAFITTQLYDDFLINKKALDLMFEKSLVQTEKAIATYDPDKIKDFESALSYTGNSDFLECERKTLSEHPDTFPYRMCAISYANSYFGLKQAIEIDSIRYSIEKSFQKSDINLDDRRWLLIALCQAAVKVAMTTGHFAQYMQPNSNNLSFYLKQRARSVWPTWVDSMAALEPIGSTHWRKSNQAFNEDSLSLLTRFKDFSLRPSIVYADPPYTDDQYSRYYHIWESIILYDYPLLSSKGRYRQDRFITPFSKKTTVNNAIHELISLSKCIEADLIISYPNNGLLMETGANLIDILKQYYNKVEIAYSIEYQHSTMGGSKGLAKHDVTEFIYFARNR